jgi:hypothetical protein
MAGTGDSLQLNPASKLGSKEVHDHQPRLLPPAGPLPLRVRLARHGALSPALELRRRAPRDAPNYWLGTIGANGKPHVRPIDAVWLEGALCFGGGDTQWVRNLSANPAATVNLASNAEAVILEGTVEQFSDAADPLAFAVARASRDKYPQYYPDPKEEPHPTVPFRLLRPSRVYAWSLEGFPKDATVWRFSARSA